MKKIAFAVYREWAYKIFTEVLDFTRLSNDVFIPLLITTPQHEFDLPVSQDYEVLVLEGKNQETLQAALRRHDIDTVCFYGWSWFVKDPVLSEYTCLCLHPSPLPKYRGGSPIQHQLVAGETDSAVSIIKMSEGVDDGDIYTQIPIPLLGYLPEILDGIVQAGVRGTEQYIEDLINNCARFTPQANLEEFPPLKRRTPADGEIHVQRAAEQTYTEIYNLVRGLQSPYPNAFIVQDNVIVHIEQIQFATDTAHSGGDIATAITERQIPFAFKVKDGSVIVTKARFEEKLLS